MQNNKFHPLLSAVSIIVMAVVAGLAMALIFNDAFTLESGDIAKSRKSFKTALSWGIMAWLVIFICDILASWGLYKVYKQKSASRSMIMGLLRLGYSLLLLYAIAFLFKAYGNLASAVFNEIYVYESLHRFQAIWQFALIVFGIHLIYLAGLVCEKKFVLRLICIMLFIAGVGYISSNIADLFVPHYEDLRAKFEAPFIIPMIFGELGLALWFIIKGRAAIA